VGDGHRVVVYDAHGIFSAPRVWWLFRLFGKADVAVLDGGLPKWKAEGRPLEEGWPILRDRHFTARRDASLVRDVTQVAASAKLGDAQILDARSPARFRGDEPEPRAGLRSGHIPGSKNVHYATLLNPDGTMKDAAGLRAAFEAAGADPARPTITTCGSGISAAILSLALERLGNRRVALYDGSWTEWGAYPDLKAERG
jgi:thiosulfate/3-mercaptopyruvate sulfurtransferase